MKLAKATLAGAMLTVISSAALAQDARTGMVTLINRIDGIIAIKLSQSSKDGATSGGATEQFKLPNNLSHAVHAGDTVTFTVTETGGAKTIATIKAQ
jgi:hypothetical protein